MTGRLDLTDEDVRRAIAQYVRSVKGYAAEPGRVRITRATSDRTEEPTVLASVEIDLPDPKPEASP